MPYKDARAEKEYHRNYHATHRGHELEMKQIALGYNTPASLAWPKRKLTETESAWIAAVIDCDGCLTLTNAYNKQRGGYNFVTHGQVSMTVAVIPERLKELCGGSIHHYSPKKRGVKDFTVWHISSNGLRWLLPQIKPHLLIKQRQAELLLEFLTIAKQGVKTRSAYNTRAQEIRVEMAMLNFRGQMAGTGEHQEPLGERAGGLIQPFEVTYQPEPFLDPFTGQELARTIILP